MPRIQLETIYRPKKGQTVKVINDPNSRTQFTSVGLEVATKALNDELDRRRALKAAQMRRYRARLKEREK